MRIFATFKDMFGELSTADLYLLTHYSPSQHHLKVWTSTKDAKVLSFTLLNKKNLKKKIIICIL